MKSINGVDSSFPIERGRKFEKSLSDFGAAWLEYGDIEKEIDVSVTLI